MEPKNDFMKSLNKLAAEIEKFNNAIYDLPEIDINQPELQAAATAGMKKKEKKALALKTLQEKFPKIWGLIAELELAAEGLGEKVDEIHDKIEDKLDEVHQLEDDKDELESKIDELQR